MMKATTFSLLFTNGLASNLGGHELAAAAPPEVPERRRRELAPIPPEGLTTANMVDVMRQDILAVLGVSEEEASSRTQILLRAFDDLDAQTIQIPEADANQQLADLSDSEWIAQKLQFYCETYEDYDVELHFNEPEQIRLYWETSEDAAFGEKCAERFDEPTPTPGPEPTPGPRSSDNHIPGFDEVMETIFTSFDHDGACSTLGDACSEAIDILGGQVRDSGACSMASGTIVQACDWAGLGDWDPTFYAQTCSDAVGALVETGCNLAIDVGATFGKDQCKEFINDAFGCSLKTSGKSLGETVYDTVFECSNLDNACETVLDTIGGAAKDFEMCTQAAEGSVQACDLIEFADEAYGSVCKFAVGNLVDSGCNVAVKAGTAFGKEQCKQFVNDEFGCNNPTTGKTLWDNVSEEVVDQLTDCDFLDSACSAAIDVAGESLRATGMCTLSTASSVAACQAVGLGPANPYSNVCSVAVGTVVALSCHKAIDLGQEFGKEQCKSYINSEYDCKRRRIDQFSGTELDQLHLPAPAFTL